MSDKEAAALPDMEDEEEDVMSEVHLGCPPSFSGVYLSRFTYSVPTNVDILRGSRGDTSIASTDQSICLDMDGDLIIPRPKKTHKTSLSINHRITSSIPGVGLQVWKAAMILSDFVLHTSITSSTFHDVIALELGAGTGLVGIILAHVAKKIFLTDYDTAILDNCAENVHLNSSLYNEDSVQVRKLDWKKPWPPTTQVREDWETPDESRYSWTLSDIKEVEGASVLLAADVIYSDELTDFLFGVLESLMSRGSKKVLYLALEKRYNFTLDDLDVVANGYWHFRKYLRDPQDTATCCTSFFGTKIDLDLIPQYLLQYDRGKDLELWKIVYSAPQDMGTRKT